MTEADRLRKVIRKIRVARAVLAEHRIMTKAWTDEARRAAAEAKRGKRGGGREKVGNWPQPGLLDSMVATVFPPKVPYSVQEQNWNEMKQIYNNHPDGGKMSFAQFRHKHFRWADVSVGGHSGTMRRFLNKPEYGGRGHGVKYDKETGDILKALVKLHSDTRTGGHGNVRARAGREHPSSRPWVRRGRMRRRFEHAQRPDFGKRIDALLDQVRKLRGGENVGEQRVRARPPRARGRFGFRFMRRPKLRLRNRARRHFGRMKRPGHAPTRYRPLHPPI